MNIVDNDGNTANCLQRDIYGDNECHYDWGTDLSVTVNATTNNVEIVAGDYVNGKLKMDHIIPYDFKCQLCGQDCLLKIPFLKRDIIIPMPRTCPIPTKMVTKHLIIPLGDHCPLHVPKTTITGTIELRHGATEEKFADATFDIFIKC